MGSVISCPSTETLNLVLDGEAEPQKLEAYEGHLQQCDECRQRHQFYSQLKSLTKGQSSQERCPELVQARILQALDQEVRKTATVTPLPNRRNRPALWGMGALAAASAALFSFAVFRPATEQATPLALSLSEDHSRCCDKPASNAPQNPAYLAEKTFGKAMPEMIQNHNLQPFDVRLCPVLKGQQVIHVLCRDSRQRVVSMYTMPSNRAAVPSASEAAPMIVDTQEARVASWQHRGWMFSLVSEAPQEELATIAGSCSYGCPKEATNPYVTPTAPYQSLPVQAIPASHHP